MRVIVLSLIVAALGLVASRAGTALLAGRDPHVHWALGLVALLPGWLVGFVALLGAGPVARLTVVTAVAWTVSAATALLGAIATEAVVRRAADEARARPPFWYWRVGALALLPALAVATLAHLLR